MACRDVGYCDLDAEKTGPDVTFEFGTRFNHAGAIRCKRNSVAARTGEGVARAAT